MLLALPLLSSAQVRKYFSVGVGLNQSTFYLQPGLFQQGEFNVLLDNPLFIGPQFNGQFNLELDKHHTFAASADIVIYSRVIAVAVPIGIKYYYDIIDHNNTPFVGLEGGYSFFLTSGPLYGVSLGYRLGKLRASFAYKNQLRRRSILEGSEFITGRLGSLSFNFEYLFRRTDKKHTSRRRRR